MDRRVKYTKMVINKCFLELLEKKEISKITVSEICTMADINRATFYRYYLDVYDLLSKMEDDFSMELKEIIEKENKNTVYAFSKSVLDAFYKRKEFLKVLFNTNNNIFFLNSFLEIVYNKCEENWRSINKELSIKKLK